MSKAETVHYLTRPEMKAGAVGMVEVKSITDDSIHFTNCVSYPLHSDVVTTHTYDNPIQIGDILIISIGKSFGIFGTLQSMKQLKTNPSIPLMKRVSSTPEILTRTRRIF